MKLVSGALLCLLLAGCGSVLPVASAQAPTTARPPTAPSLSVENKSGRRLGLFYLRGDIERKDVRVEPGSTVSFTYAFASEGKPCASGILVARDGWVDFARIEQPCAGATWTIGPWTGQPSATPTR
jgi:hypothetical protein